MKILFLDSPAFAKKDMLEAFHNCNIETDLFMHEDYNVRKSAAYDAAFDAAVENTSYDFVFSFNYYPILATCAHRHNLRYVSYVYDSPLVALYSFTITYPTNYIFLFDYPIYEELKQGGIDRVFYLPLAALRRNPDDSGFHVVVLENGKQTRVPVLFRLKQGAYVKVSAGKLKDGMLLLCGESSGTAVQTSAEKTSAAKPSAIKGTPAGTP